MSTRTKRLLPEAQTQSPNKKRRLYNQDPNTLSKHLYLQLYGENGKVQLTNTIGQYLEKHETKLRVHDLHWLILWLFQCNVSPPKWIQVRHKHAVKQIVMIQVDGLTKDNATSLPIFNKVFTPTHCYPLKIDTSIFSKNGVSEIFLRADMSKLPNVSKLKHWHTHQTYNVENFLLTKAELRTNSYPDEHFPEYKDFVSTKN